MDSDAEESPMSDGSDFGNCYQDDESRSIQIIGNLHEKNSTQKDANDAQS